MFDDAVNKINSLKDKAQEVLGDEEKSDSVLDSVAGAAKKVTGGKFDDKIDGLRDVADGKLGSE